MARRSRPRRGRGGKVELLSSVPLFSACTKRELSRIAALCDKIEVPEGRVLTREGEAGWEFFVIVDGEAKASMRGRRGATLGPGSFFGEMSLLDHGTRTATVTAETDMELLVLNARDFSGLLLEAPTVSRRILEVLAQRLREAERAQPQH
ncbi:MAG TPA: cyclic nucleotide-binding domain-containing protein [Solirubrobacterales bacterium]|nr:cyclic nucleotide-binding domain-containing protein [Solirubrobacterales bacterium]